MRGSERLNQEKREIRTTLKILEDFLGKIGYASVETRRDPEKMYTRHLEPFQEVFSLQDESGNKLRFSAGDKERVYLDGEDLHGRSELSFIYKEGEETHEADSEEFNNLPVKHVGALHALLPKLVAKVIELHPAAEERLVTFLDAAKRSVQ